jgi:hypothetical protein
LSNENAPYEKDVIDFWKGLGEHLKASPNENQYIFEHILKQIREGAKLHPDHYIKGKHGYEPVTVLEASGKKIAKRIFHPKDVKGVDFLISKLARPGYIGLSVVQVKRNHGTGFFTLVENSKTKELTQLRNFSQWSSGYYLMIDETNKPPQDCFVLTSELISMIQTITGQNVLYGSLSRVDIPNHLVHKYSRGSHVFYKAFYDCRRGAQIKIDKYLENASEYVSQTMRSLVELLIQSEQNRPANK